MRKMRVFAGLCVGALLSGCGGVSLWPFGSGGSTEQSRKPSDAIEYQCDGGNGFFVRNLDANAVWLIAPDRQIRLDRIAGATDTAYAAGKVRLEISAQSATLLDPPARFLGCKRAGT